jgi:hypothetical protein
MVLGLSIDLPHALASGLLAHGASQAAAHKVSTLPPISILFAAFLGYNPIEHLAGASVLHGVSPAGRTVLTGHSFLPRLISAPFEKGLHEAFLFAIVACVVAAFASMMRGGRYQHGQQPDAHTRGGELAVRRIENIKAREEQHAG